MTVESAEVLVITPHPDDAEFGVAGTIVHWTRQGRSVVYIVCTNGDKGSSDANMKMDELARTREQEQLAAAKMLGVREVVFLRHPDQGLEDTATFRKEIVSLIRGYRPYTVVTSDPYRRYVWHRDHRITGQVVLDAIFPYARDVHSYPDLLQEGLRPHRVGEALFWASEDPNYRSDITDTFDIKLAALGCHKSQLGDELSPDLKKWLIQRAKDNAQGEEYEMAEAFHRVEILW